MSTDFALAIILILVRSIVDMFSALQILMEFRTASVAPSSLVFGKGEHVRDPRKMVIPYLKTDFVTDMVPALPIPQVSKTIEFEVFCSLTNSLLAAKKPDEVLRKRHTITVHCCSVYKGLSDVVFFLMTIQVSLNDAKAWIHRRLQLFSSDVGDRRCSFASDLSLP
ncbi:unnamed protein product [Fraxinus pennsylvanica]|uniref:Uncharacterized protein n=1 Tax=Fraxinus pennsylvanica TaxID=56036 RepID=A0AAD2A8N0_9LAMI|nr:unnamed protein product [Fraxinus pennsylvanica]